ncbi:MAG: hypothetical protein H6722_32305 [Sandaracinus sp.]|nr:hypothetical protein [Sandaracinus sp.]
MGRDRARSTRTAKEPAFVTTFLDGYAHRGVDGIRTSRRFDVGEAEARTPRDEYPHGASGELQETDLSPLPRGVLDRKAPPKGFHHAHEITDEQWARGRVASFTATSARSQHLPWTPRRPREGHDSARKAQAEGGPAQPRRRVASKVNARTCAPEARQAQPLDRGARISSALGVVLELSTDVRLTSRRATRTLLAIPRESASTLGVGARSPPELEVPS